MGHRALQRSLLIGQRALTLLASGKYTFMMVIGQGVLALLGGLALIPKYTFMMVISQGKSLYSLPKYIFSSSNESLEDIPSVIMMSSAM
jgi:hypothetical protein